jgi:hypothetical protein
MKIPPANPLPARPAADTNRAATRRGHFSTDAARADDPSETAEGAASERDFASVFEEVASRPEPRDEEAGEGERRVSRESERAEHDGSARRRNEREGDGTDHAGGDGKGGGFENRAAVREVTAAGEPSAARSILHVADLERIVSAVRAQLVDGGRHVVTIEMRRSVLEGLKVTLSADGGGRVTAEFIAASERVRSQLDARAAELAELLRGRGVNLAALRTSVEAGADARGGDGGGPREDSARSVSGARAAADSEADASDVTRADAPTDGIDGGTASTYRA